MLSFTLVAMQAAAQVDETAPAEDAGNALEEVVVVGTRPGDKVKADPLYEAMLRQQMMEEIERMRREEEEAWRDSNLTYQSSEESRLVWGYDPKADRDMRTDVDFNRWSADRTKPATLFRAKF